MVEKSNMLSAARAYLQAGLCVLPARRAEKRPALGSWRQYQKRLPTTAEVDAWFANGHDGLCLVCGVVSENLELIDFDLAGEAFDAWHQRITQTDPELAAELVIEASPSGGWHVVYRCSEAICGNLKLAQRLHDGKPATLIETRGEGGLFLCAPTAGYELFQGELADVPVLTAVQRDVLLRAAWDLNEYVPPVVDGPTVSANVGQRDASSGGQRQMSAEISHSGDGPSNNGMVGQRSPLSVGPCGSPPEMGARPGDDFNLRGDVRPVLAQYGWVRTKTGENEYWRRPGKDTGTSATLKDGVFYVFSSNAAPFEPDRGYSPFAVYALLEHGGDFSVATRALRQQGYGSDGVGELDNSVDLSGILATVDGEPKPKDEISNPGPIPEQLFEVPGLVRQVMDFTLGKAPYPNLGLAFCGALALQSYLCARKVRTTGDLRPNIYLLALASSGTGKDFPRKVNARVLFETGQVAALGDKFASGEGIQDALVRSNAMLFQNDEMDGVLRQINMDRENKRESIPNILLTLYTSASDIYPIRVKAGQKEASHIDQPHLTLFGTATPKCFYESLSQRMLTNGLFARMMVVDIGKRGRGQTPGSARDLPEGILQTARWWDEFCPGQRQRGNLYAVHPEPRVVPFTSEAEQAVDRLQRMGEDEYDRADAANDEVGKAAWSRTCENAKKLALLYACSENHQEPLIGLAAVEWASAFAMHQTRRQLYLAATYVAENPFHAECLKLLRKLEDEGGQMARRQLMRAMRCKLADFEQIITTLKEQGDIVAVDIPTKTKPARGYQIT